MLLFINVRADLYAVFFRERVLFGVMMLILSPALFYCALRARPRSAFVLLSCAMVAFLFCGNLMVFPKWNAYKSPRPMVEQMRQFTRGKIPWVYYGSMRGVYVYYMGSHAIAIDEHEQAKLQALGNTLEEFFVLTRKRDLPEVQQALGPVTLLMERTVGDTVMVFVGYLRKTS
jgi:hypothetical protein